MVVGFLLNLGTDQTPQTDLTLAEKEIRTPNRGTSLPRNAFEETIRAQRALDCTKTHADHCHQPSWQTLRANKHPQIGLDTTCEHPN